ncbi:MAG: hypothetical protein U0U69_10855 [Acidimicrobiia bacterium]
MTAPSRAPSRHQDPGDSRHQPKHARRPRLRDVTELRPRRRSRMVPFVVTVVLLALFGILYVHVRAARSAFELAQIEKTVRAKQDQNEKLSVTKAYLEAPERIRQEATGRLRMKAPATVHYLSGGEVSGAGTPTSDPDEIPQAPALPQP